MPAGITPQACQAFGTNQYQHLESGANRRQANQLFAEDGFVLQSNQPPVRGRSAIEAAYAGQGSSPLRLRALAYAVEGNTGYIIGAYSYGNNVGDTGKFTLTLKRVGDGRWLIFSDMDNTSAPPRAR